MFTRADFYTGSTMLGTSYWGLGKAKVGQYIGQHTKVDENTLMLNSSNQNVEVRLTSVNTLPWLD